MASKRKQQAFADFKVVTDGFPQASKDLRAAGKQFPKALAKALKDAVSPVVAEAKSNASFSQKIPGSIKAMANSKGVSIQAGSAKAGNAAPLENAGKTGTFKHRVFGRNVWVTQPAHPYIKPAIDANVDGSMLDAVTAAMDDVFRSAGFK